MGRLVSMACGRRPGTAQVALDSLRLQDPSLCEDLTLVVWASDPFWNGGMAARILTREGGSRAENHNYALSEYRERNKESPAWWLILDDDVVLCQGAFERMTLVMLADPEIGILGAWNDGCQRREDGTMLGYSKVVAGEVVQYGNDFNVGGAVQLWSVSTIERYGGYAERPWLEDHDITVRVRQAGQHAAICRTVHATILRDDGYDPGYRTEQTTGMTEAVKAL